MKSGRNSTGSNGSSKVRRRPASAVDQPRQQLQFVVGPPPGGNPFEAPAQPSWSQAENPGWPANNFHGQHGQNVAFQQPQQPQQQQLAAGSAAVSSRTPPLPSVVADNHQPEAREAAGPKPMELDEFDDDDDALFAAPESFQMLEDEMRKYESQVPFNNNQTVQTVDALQQEIDALPDIVLDEGALSDLLGDTQPSGNGTGNNANPVQIHPAGPSALRPLPAPTEDSLALQRELQQMRERNSILETQLAMKEGEVSTVRRKYNSLEGDVAKLRETVSEKEDAVSKALAAERAKHAAELDKLQTDMLFLEQEQKGRRAAPAASQSMDAANPSFSQAWRSTPSKQNGGFARPAPPSVSKMASQTPVRQKRMPTFEDFGAPQPPGSPAFVMPQARPAVGFAPSALATAPYPVAPSTLVVQGDVSKPAQPALPVFSADKHRLARLAREARAKDERRNQLIRELFADPAIAPPPDPTRAAHVIPSPSLFSTSLTMQSHSSVRLTKDNLARFNSARLLLTGQLTAIVAKQNLPLASIIPALEPFVDSAVELGAAALVLFSVRLVKMLVKADEGCRDVLLDGKLEPIQAFANRGSMPMDVDQDVAVKQGLSILGHLCRCVKHSAYAGAQNQSATFIWIPEASTKELCDNVLSILQSLSFGRDGQSLDKLSVIFDSGWHRHMCLKKQSLSTVTAFVSLCATLLKSPAVFTAILAPASLSHPQTTVEDESKTPILDQSFLDQLSSFFIEDYPANPPPNYRLDSLRLRHTLIRLFSAIAANEYPQGAESLLDRVRVLFWVVKSLSFEIMDCIEVKSPDRDMSASFVVECVRLLQFFTVRRLDALRRLLQFPSRQAHDLFIVNMGRLANGALLDVLPEVREVEDAARDMLQLIAYDNEEKDIMFLWGGTKDQDEEGDGDEAGS